MLFDDGPHPFRERGAPVLPATLDRGRVRQDLQGIADQLAVVYRDRVTSDHAYDPAVEW